MSAQAKIASDATILLFMICTSGKWGIGEGSSMVIESTLRHSGKHAGNQISKPRDTSMRCATGWRKCTATS
jgi:hypothetical protein